MNIPFTYNASSASTASVDLKSMLETARRLMPARPELIMAIETTLEKFRAATDEFAANAEKTEPGLPLGFYVSPLGSLDVVEESGWVYIGTTRQLAEAVKQWGSLTLARQAWEFYERLRLPKEQAKGGEDESAARPG